MNSVGSAQLDLQGEEGSLIPAPEFAGVRQQAAERLAAHRLRRARHERSGGQPGAIEAVDPAATRKNRVASAVAERYAQTPSFRAVLAAEARRSIEQAAAAAEIAARNAAAVAEAQGELLLELELELDRYDEPVEFSVETAQVRAGSAACSAVGSAAGPVRAPELGAAAKQYRAGGLTVRLYEDLGPLTRLEQASGNYLPGSPLDAREERALDAEIAFRHAPVFEPVPPPEPAVPLPANLLEFPRQLVAARKARPRLAEGPLRDDAPTSPQLRIFEVDPHQILTIPDEVSSMPEWSSIWLDAQAPAEPVFDPENAPDDLLASLLPPQVAPMHRRLMAAATDAALVLAGFVAFCAAAVWAAGTLTLGLPVAIAAAAALLGLYLIYQLLFFSLSVHTPGMRYARIGLCTFSDENPSRSAMRKRILAKLIAVCPLGLGVVWALLDDDRLGWHDRISRMYHRAY